MKPKLYAILLCVPFLTQFAAQSQTHKLGDAAPSLRVGQWIKGKPIDHFEKGRIYIVEFWATWCAPCMAAMPHLSTIAKTYRQKLSVIALDIYEQYEHVTLQKVKQVVAAKKDTMDFAVVTEDARFTVKDWLVNFGEKPNGIPRTFVVDENGKIAWTGSPNNLGKVLPQIINHTWNVKKELRQRKINEDWQLLDQKAAEKLSRNKIITTKTTNMVVGVELSPDSVLIIMNAEIKKYPQLKYAPATVNSLFKALLKVDPNKAYEFGKQVLTTSTYTDPDYTDIIDDIRRYTGKKKLPPKIYELGARARQMWINYVVYPQLVDISSQYHKMAAWYKLAGNYQRANWADKKALELSKKRS